ncbi:MAG: methionyl-tRNA formyltransferase [Planctomycetaceae bacterium]|nr:methionyl-tRNA formyltransferase [Planctomycetaceae bacterium]
MPLRLVLLGTGDFALPAFRAVVQSEHSVCAVFTQPDHSGAGHHRHINPVRQLGEDAGIPVHQPARVNAPEILDILRSYQADVFLVAAYGQILKPAFLAIPRLGAFNLHGSILPRHRGAAPVQYSIWKGDQRAGVTMFQIEPALDSGPIAGIVETQIQPGETSGLLMSRLAELCVPLTLQVLQQLESGTARLVPQDPAGVTLAPRISRDNGTIDWNQNATAVDCQIRAMQPWPKAQTWLIGPDAAPQRCIVLEAAVISDQPELPNPNSVSPGAITVLKGRLFIAAAQSWLEILRIQAEGRKPVDGRSFVNGYQLDSSFRFGTA